MEEPIITPIVENTPAPAKKKRTNGRPLHRFQKGVSGNPEGRPKGTVSITEAIRRKLQEVFPEKDPTKFKEKKLYVDKLVERILQNAIENGETRSQKDIWAYMDGQPKATIDIGADKDSLSVLTEYFRGIAKPKK